MILPAGVYRHYKGGLYQVLGIAEHTETHEKVVVYLSLTSAHLPGPRMRVRPLEGPEGFITPELVNNAPRFEYVGYEIPPLMQTQEPNELKYGGASE